MGGVAQLGTKLVGGAIAKNPILNALGGLGSGQGLAGGGVVPTGVVDPASQVAAANLATLPPVNVNTSAKSAPPTVAASNPAIPQPGVGGGRKYEGMARQAAAKWGIDPDTAVRVLNAEGGLDTWQQSKVRNKRGVREPSYGPGQFLIGGGNTGFPEGLGNRFIKDTGLDPRDPANAAPYFDYMMKEVSQRGWGQWYGAKAAGVGNFAGVGGRPAGHSPQLDQVMGGTPYNPNQLPSFNSRMFGGEDMQPGEAEQGQKTALESITDAAIAGGKGGVGPQVATGGSEDGTQPAVDTGAEEIAAQSQSLLQATRPQPTSRSEARKATVRQRLMKGGQL